METAVEESTGVPGDLVRPTHGRVVLLVCEGHCNVGFADYQMLEEQFTRARVDRLGADARQLADIATVVRRLVHTEHRAVDGQRWECARCGQRRFW